MEIKPITLNYFFGMNCYLIKTEVGCFLVDTGIKKKRAQLEQELVDAGCSLGDLKLIIITHGHIAVGGKKVSSPSFLVPRTDEADITYAPSSSLANLDHPIRQTLADIPGAGAKESTTQKESPA